MKEIHFAIRASSRLIAIVSVLYAFTGLVICFLSVAMSFKGVAILLHSIHFYTLWYNSLSLKTKEAIVYLQPTTENTWILGNREGEACQAVLQRGSLCTAYLVILHFNTAHTQNYHCVLLLPDSLSADAFRQLRQQLRRYW